MKILGVLAAAVVALNGVSEPKVLTSNGQGEYNGMNYEFWRQNNTDNASMTLGDGGAFDCSWEKVSNVLFLTGKKLSSANKTQEETGEITLEYGCDYNPKGNSYLYVDVVVINLPPPESDEAEPEEKDGKWLLTTLIRAGAVFIVVCGVIFVIIRYQNNKK